MKIYRPAIYPCIFLFTVILFSCLKESSFEKNPADGMLVKDNNGDCIPITIKGNYTRNKPLTSDHSLTVTVDVTKTGSYTIASDTVNGYSFQSSGNFGATGLATVLLQGKGTPAREGNDHFVIHFNASACVADLAVQNEQVLPALFTLEGAPGSCSNASVQGNFITGVALDNSNKVVLPVQVSRPGSYQVNTTTVNGYSFTATGSFASTGLQLMTLQASGTPLQAGIDLFPVVAGSSSCQFSLTAITAASTNNKDYLPLAHQNRWVYDDLMNPGDSIVRTVVDSLRLNGFVYRIVEDQDKYGLLNTYQLRKGGSEYFEYASVDKYTRSFLYSPSIINDLPILREFLVTGDNWKSTEYSGPASFGQTILLQYLYACMDASATITINNKAFKDVKVIRIEPQIRSLMGHYGNTGEKYLIFYAKGIGVIYYKKTAQEFIIQEYRIRNWQVR